MNDQIFDALSNASTEELLRIAQAGTKFIRPDSKEALAGLPENC